MIKFYESLQIDEKIAFWCYVGFFIFVVGGVIFF